MPRARVAAQELRLRRSADAGPVYFHGETMRPFLGEGDLLIVTPVEWDDIAVGDVITYRYEDKFPTRRVVEANRAGGMLILRGDSIPGRPDFPVRRQDVLGRAEVRIRDGAELRCTDPEWRRATRRALARERAAGRIRALPWPFRGLLGRLFPGLRCG